MQFLYIFLPKHIAWLTCSSVYVWSIFSTTYQWLSIIKFPPHQYVWALTSKSQLFSPWLTLQTDASAGIQNADPQVCNPSLYQLSHPTWVIFNLGLGKIFRNFSLGWKIKKG